MSAGKAVQRAQMVQTATTAILEHLCNYKLQLNHEILFKINFKLNG